MRFPEQRLERSRGLRWYPVLERKVRQVGVTPTTKRDDQHSCVVSRSRSLQLSSRWEFASVTETDVSPRSSPTRNEADVPEWRTAADALGQRGKQASTVDEAQMPKRFYAALGKIADTGCIALHEWVCPEADVPEWRTAADALGQRGKQASTVDEAQ